ncbi:hypothetical protein [Actinoplanes sp. NPDC051494]|uniref:hypothetical protein n=1 Tax=Actinoplanes sp. NPDC051494 TaxID=3363907 RepID=UPI003795BF31
MRGGLDDALDKLARRDQLRRRATGESAGTPPAVTELVEAIAAVVARHPDLGVTVGVEGVTDPMLLHFTIEDGIVQVSADHTVAQRPPEPAHDDVIDVDLDDTPYPVYEPEPPPTYQYERPQQNLFEETAGPEQPRGMPEPLPEPIPLRVDEAETEQAARRLAALLREEPNLLRSQD